MELAGLGWNRGPTRYLPAYLGTSGHLPTEYEYTDTIDMHTYGGTLPVGRFEGR